MERFPNGKGESTSVLGVHTVVCVPFFKEETELIKQMEYTYNNQIKKTVRELVFDNFPRGNITTLVGPELILNLRYIERYVFRTVGGYYSKINLYEYDKTVYVHLLEEFVGLLKNNQKIIFPQELMENVEIKNDDIVNAESQKIMDLDFCTSFVTNQKTINKLFREQYATNFKGRTGTKAFTITCCERDAKEGSFTAFTMWYLSVFGRYRTDKMLEELDKEGMKLGAKMDMVNDQRNIYATVYSWDNGNNHMYASDVDVDVKTQKEFIIKYNAGGGPMFIWFIVYTDAGVSVQ
ncbi:MAG: hypothetical protein ACTSQF_09090 [Candidatus Heimdallarchaeaceae archaeon]